jgi:hypothetical protein
MGEAQVPQRACLSRGNPIHITDTGDRGTHPLLSMGASALPRWSSACIDLRQ